MVSSEKQTIFFPFLIPYRLFVGKMKSAKDMNLLIDKMTYYQDISADMDW